MITRAVSSRTEADALLRISSNRHGYLDLPVVQVRRHRRNAFVHDSHSCVCSGTAVVLEKEAWLFTDGRYHQQASKELSDTWTLHKCGLPGKSK